MKKIILILCISLLSTSVYAQDDVSIMDLKETVYILINQVKHLKKVNIENENKMQKRVSKLQRLVLKNIKISTQISKRNTLLRQRNLQLRKQEANLGNEILKIEDLLNSYIEAEKKAVKHISYVYPHQIITLNSKKTPILSLKANSILNITNDTNDTNITSTKAK